jgi:alpha-tubulin suppressor-like RCC1 family protein
VAASRACVVALRANGQREAWGENYYGRQGLASTANLGIPLSSLGLPVPSGIDAATWLQLDLGSAHSLGLKSDGTIWAAGGNNGIGYPLLGIGWPELNLYTAVPMQVGISDQWGQVRVGDYHNLAITRDKRLFGWGSNDSGEVGDGTFEPVEFPTELSPRGDWRQIAAGPRASAGIREDGSLWYWGSLREYTVTTVVGGGVWGAPH